jgi:hypothetical protein
VSETRSYTNKEGMTVTVDLEHLEKAVEVKLELQDKSPSRRISWFEHKRVMEEEGYGNSDTSESYRCLVKDYQKRTGRLHNLTTHAELVHTSKLDAIKRTVGDFRFEKQANQDILREINKIHRDLSRTAVLADEFRNVLLDDIDFSVPHYIYEPRLQNSKNKAILVITDWHIGVVVDDCVGNYYNFEIATKRIEHLIKETLDYCKLYGVNDLHVIGLGDWIEHQYMRDNQSQDCEFSPSLQIAKAKKLIFKLLVNLSEYVNVSYASIAGNHDRFEGNKNKSFDDDNANVVIVEGLKDLLELVNTDRINLLDIAPDAKEIRLDVNGKKFKFVHGDKDRGGMKKRLKDHISNHNEFIDYFIHGHLHNFYVQDDDNGRMIIGVGSTMGKNNYSKEIGSTTDASQALIIVREDGNVTPIKIDLQIN